MFSKKLFLACIAAMACASASGAAPVAVTGNVGDVAFPDKARSYLSEGDFVNIGNLKQMRTDLSKDQVRLLLGNPHFREGIFGSDEWNYIFNFRTGVGEEYITCQYQVRYDKEGGKGYRSRSMHWDGPDCMALANQPPPAPATPVAQVETRFNLSADVLFPFARSGIADILSPGREELGALAEKIKDAEALTVRVIGHTDPIGSDADNQVLSERRAESVRSYLVENGVPEAGTSAEGRGESRQVKDCRNLPRQELIACLAPNRRVEVVVTGSML